MTDVAEAAAAIRAGRIVTIDGADGAQLACDATNEVAVAELRERMLRTAKPFTVMVADVAAARELGEYDAIASELLASPAAPIVLAPKRASRLAPNVAPGIADIGVTLPSTPVQQSLASALGDVPVVMTRGEAGGGEGDASIARVVDGAPQVVRRARGYAAMPEPFPLPLATPTFAVGGDHAAAFAYGVGDAAHVSPQFGDLADLSVYEAFEAALERQRRSLRVAPKQVVCDLHPDYATTRLAEAFGLPMIRVQHHHAHFASAFADARLHGPAIGVILDHGGYGGDGTTWGGEILVGDPAAVWRAAHLQTVAQPGGERVALEPWRMAVAHLMAAGEAYADVHPDAERIAGTVPHAAHTSSVGRLCDAVAVIAGVATNAAFDGHAARLLEASARTAGPEQPYPFELAGDELIIAPMIRAIVKDLRMHVAAARIARRFHTTIVEMVARACQQLARGEGLRDVVLSGGVFQNVILATEVPARLRELGLVPHVHRRMPPNDGGLAFGQLAVAAARDGVGA